MSNKLLQLIKLHILHHGPLSVADYWNLCLSHPQHGYYITRDPLGKGGDFITAPEISQLFGEMVGIWAVEQWIRLGQPNAVYIVECGPGRGTLMSDLLRVAKIIPEFIEAIQIHLIETSPTLRAKQGEVLKGYQVVWHESLSTLPDNAPLIVIGNEFLDALPIQQFVVKDGKCFERMIGIEGDDLVFGLYPTPSPLIFPPEGSGKQEVFEISPARENFIQLISHRIASQTGAGLMIDYGHLVSDFGDTFQAVKNHQFCSVLENCGEADLTSHVDFSILKKIAERENLSVTLQTQGNFLKRMGIEPRANQLMQKSDAVKDGFHRLIDDDKMGILFKVMEIFPHPDPLPEGRGR
jgi:NADH dehydrogenase [ubiquinone] 1 alpha subcomplex assembly factor 7